MVKALNHQEPTESRRLWREVTEEWISLPCENFDFIHRKIVIKIKIYRQYSIAMALNEILKRILKSIILKMQPLGSADWSRNSVTMPYIALKII